MTLRRTLFSVMTLALLFAGLYTGEYIYYIGFALLISVLIYAIVTNVWVLLDFKYLQTITPERTSKGKDATLVIQIHNDKPFIFPFIRIYYQLPNSVFTGELEEDVLSILPFQYGETRRDFHCAFRGSFTIGITSLEVMDMFGLFRFHINLSKRPYYKPLTLNIYPRIIHLQYLPLPQIKHEGMQNSQLQKSYETAMPSDIREYRYGDPLKRIHWKASSKLQDILILDHETTTQPHALLYMEAMPPEAPNSMIKHEIEDQLVETVTAISHYILNKWLPLRLTVYGEDRKELSGSNPHDFQAFYDLLSEVNLVSPYTMENVMQIESQSFKQNGSLILVLHQLSYSLFNQLCIFRQNSIFPMVFLVQHRDQENRDYPKMLEDLNNKGIPSFQIYSDERLDEALEVIL
jgi:uncharacterized protein (DUF58 family)